ncbi:MAG: MnhB domain-containing protein [Candidatus Caldarchaeum sp.]|nr:cation:proton antiporter [Candidatus Caldarchaeum sp.]MDW8063645.1 MnhB domain-containing protein [Candidatus Caldarchaeum sp.]
MTSVVARVVAGAVLYIGTLFSVTLLFAGHYEPGGGFIGGVMAASVLAMLYIIFGKSYVESRFRIDYFLIATVGLLISSAVALLPVLFGKPILTNILFVLSLPFGEFKLASSTIFDIGVYFTVIGVILSVLKSASGSEVHE